MQMNVKLCHNVGINLLQGVCWETSQGACFHASSTLLRNTVKWLITLIFSKRITAGYLIVLTTAGASLVALVTTDATLLVNRSYLQFRTRP